MRKPTFFFFAWLNRATSAAINGATALVPPDGPSSVSTRCSRPGPVAVGPPLGGVFTATQGLKTAWNTPLDERGIIGMAMGIAMAGEHCVAEIQFCDYIFNTIELVKMAGNRADDSGGCGDPRIHLSLPLL